jgi:hypothetical protein
MVLNVITKNLFASFLGAGMLTAQNPAEKAAAAFWFCQGHDLP